MLHAIIMAGGAGTRFWPASRADRPKQLLSLASDDSMIQDTLGRLGELVPPERAMVVTNERLVEAIRGQLPALAPAAVLGEPFKRDTAPAIGLAALWVTRHDDDATMLVMPADHVIQPPEKFQAAVKQAARLVEEHPSWLATFGIKPTYAAETFGYIERGEALKDAQAGDAPAYSVRRFREKPDAATAQKYLDSGKFYWNSGIFVWRAQTILDSLDQYEPDMLTHLQNIADAFDADNFDGVFREEFEAIRGKSIDYAVMERSEEVVVIEAPYEWDDVGNWPSLARLRGTDEAGNTLVGKHLGIDTKNTIVRTEGGHLVVTVGLDDLIVVHTPDATLVATREAEEQIREVVKQLKEKGMEEYL